MAFYKGKAANGEDMQPIEGMYISPDGKEWGSSPYPNSASEFVIHNPNKEENTLTEYDKKYDKLRNHIDGKRSILDEYFLIQSKKSELPRVMRDFVIGIIEEEQ